MKFVFLCDSNYLKGDYSAFTSNFPVEHELLVMSAEDFLKAKRFPEGTFAILTERSTWQKNFSLFRYFGLLSMLEVFPLGLVGRFRRQDALKGRSAVKHQEFILNPASTTEELSALLNKFIAAPPVSFSYPKGAAKA